MQLIQESQHGYSCSWHAGNELHKGSSDLRFCNAQSHAIFKDMLNFQRFQFTTFRVVIIPYEVQVCKSFTSYWQQ